MYLDLSDLNINMVDKKLVYFLLEIFSSNKLK